MDTQDGDFKTCTLVVSLSVVVIVSARGQQVCHLVQYLGNEIIFIIVLQLFFSSILILDSK